MYSVLAAINYSCKRQMEMNIGQNNTHNNWCRPNANMENHYALFVLLQWSSQWYYWLRPPPESDKTDWVWRRSEALVSAGGWRHVSQGQPQWSAWPHPVLSSVSNSLVRDAGLDWSGVIPPTPTHTGYCTGNFVPLSPCHPPIYSCCSTLDVWTQCWDTETVLKIFSKIDLW